MSTACSAGGVFRADCYLPGGTNGAIGTRKISRMELNTAGATPGGIWPQAWAGVNGYNLVFNAFW